MHPGAAKRSLIAETPGSSPLSMRLGLWSGWVGETRKTATAKESAIKPNPNWMRKKKTGKGIADGPEPEKHNASGPRDPPPPTLAVAKPLELAEAAIRAATLAPSQSGAKYFYGDAERKFV